MRAGDAQNIDASTFDAEKAFLVYLKNNTVSSLVQKNIDLQNGIATSFGRLLKNHMNKISKVLIKTSKRSSSRTITNLLPLLTPCER